MNTNFENVILNSGTMERWEREDEEFLVEMKRVGEDEAITFVNSSRFTADLRRKARALGIDDFMELGGFALNMKRISGDPDFGVLLCELLTKYDLLDEDGDVLSPAAETCVTGFLETMWRSLGEYDNQRHKS